MRASLTFLTVVAFVICAVRSFADEGHRTIDASRVPDAGRLSTVDIAITKTPPDPSPLVEKTQWVFDLQWNRGDVWLLGVHGLELQAPQATPRVMGRFALELYEGLALIERARFDFPLLTSVEPDGGISLNKKLRTRIGVIFPATKRGTRLQLWDRATDRRWALPWPPQDGPTVPADGGILSPPSAAQDGGK